MGLGYGLETEVEREDKDKGNKTKQTGKMIQNTIDEASRRRTKKEKTTKLETSLTRLGFYSL